MLPFAHSVPAYFFVVSATLVESTTLVESALTVESAFTAVESAVAETSEVEPELQLIAATAITRAKANKIFFIIVVFLIFV